MNHKLISLLKAPLTEVRKKAILQEIKDANPQESDLLNLVMDEDSILRVAQVAANYVDEATARVSQDKTWDALVGTTMISEGLAEMMSNQSLISYTQAVMLVTIALTKENNDAETQSGRLPDAKRRA